MRKSLIALLLVTTLPAAAMAMPGGMRDGGPCPHGGKQGPRMFQELDLTREQQREMRKLMGEQMQQRRDVTQRYLDKLPEAERQAMQDELQAGRDKTHQSMRALLKPEQQKAFDESLKKMEEKRAERAEFLKWKAERDQKN
ncbi:Spy/CpxP family protein refolding chaperone [Stutzerimonas stutzeri]|uniref:Spy/CpxP family protein refolding chaperone n=1 Tax=Stutzerimonas sp. S1 TaxID=3030652 RepID=UPI0022251056|nr:Spy/CpxP family protein refolding chaperone [Stutzerimonas sp. S1]MCW3150775.1 Spy/CpxP family protein refolding chaperone [Stutzerimonas sp. S1]